MDKEISLNEILYLLDEYDNLKSLLFGYPSAFIQTFFHIKVILQF